MPIANWRNENPPLRGVGYSLKRNPARVWREVRRRQWIRRVLKQDLVLSGLQISQKYAGRSALLLPAVDYLLCVRRPVVERAAAVRADLLRRASLGTGDEKAKGWLPIPPKHIVQNL